MIVDLPDTTTSKISKQLVKIREQGGAVALGRVLTLIITTNSESAEEAIGAANSASREHPCRIICLVEPNSTAKSALDAEIRVGGDAGASEVIVLRPNRDAGKHPQSLVTGLLLPDAPVVAWWPNVTPENVSESEIGRIATRRITDAAAQKEPINFLLKQVKTYAPGDTDFSWTRLTLWRAQLAAVLDQPPRSKVLSAEVSGDTNNPSVHLLTGWLAAKLQCEVLLRHQDETAGIKGIHYVRLKQEQGEIEIKREKGNLATLNQSNQPPKELSLPVRSLRDCLAEDLRRLDPDLVFQKVLEAGIR